MKLARRIVGLSLAAGLTACAGYGGSGLEAGRSDIGAVMRAMGAPALQWTTDDGRRQLAYPRGPQGLHTFMAHIGPDGKLERIENVLTAEHFARVRPGMTTEDVTRLLGPVTLADGVTYFPRRDELVWDWRYCSDWNEITRFHVLFDGTAHTVRSTMSVPELSCGSSDGGTCWCGR